MRLCLDAKQLYTRMCVCVCVCEVKRDGQVND